MFRFFYICLLRLHPRHFRQRFGDEMLLIFDESSGRRSLAGLLFDGAISLVRQWVLRPEFLQEPLSSAPAQPASDGVPTFFAFEDVRLRSATLIYGALLSLIAFGMISVAASGARKPALSTRLATMQRTGNPQSILSRTSGAPARFGDRMKRPARIVAQARLPIEPQSPIESTRSDISPAAPPHPATAAMLFQAPGSASSSIAPIERRSGGEYADIVSTLISQFDKSDVVALGEWHGTREDSDLRIQLIRHPQFPVKVRHIVIECGNSLHQAVLDRHIQGEEVPRDELQKIWRDITSPGGCDSPVYEQLLFEVRTINRRLPPARRMRVLAGGPPIDWAAIKSYDDVAPFITEPDAFPASLLGREVLRKGHKALVIFGAGHLWRGTLGVVLPNDATLAARIDKDFPGKLHTVIRLGGQYSETEKLETLIRTDKRPMLLPLTDPAFGTLDANQFVGRDVPIKLFPPGTGLAKVADSCIYNGTAPDTTIHADTGVDPVYDAEKDRRRRLRQRPKK